MYIEDFESFFQQSAELFKARPLETRYCIKYRNCDGKLVLRVTDDRTCLQYKTDQQADLKKLERLNMLFLALGAKGDVAPEDIEMPEVVPQQQAQAAGGQGAASKGKKSRRKG